MATTLPSGVLNQVSVLSLRCFAAVVETQSFSAAARQLRLAPSSVTKHVRLIERALNVALVHRTTRRVSVTDEGRRFYSQCLGILDQIDSAALGMAAEKELAGHLRVTSPPSFAAAILGPHIETFLRDYPGITMDVVVSSATDDLIRNRIDVAISVHEEPQSKQAHFHLAPCPLTLCAAPGYIARNGMPETAQDLLRHECLSARFSDLAEGWTLGRGGNWQVVDVGFRLLSDNGDLLRQACLGGAGIGNFYHFHVREDLRTGRLVRVLPDYDSQPQSVFAIVPHREIIRPQAQAFIAFIRTLLEPE
jgi:DNA-binding transcriptional LysR family regulator